MTIFTIDETNNITAFANAQQAAEASTTPFDLFTDQKELAELIAGWPAERLLATYNSLPGVKPVKALKDPKTAASKIWDRVERLGQMVAPEPVAAKTDAEPAKPKTERKAKGRAQAAKGAPVKAKATKKATPAKAAPKGKRAVKAQDAAPREGSKTETIVALLECKGGATLAEIMKATGWQAHSVRGFVSGTLGKKMGRTVDSTKREDGERVYQLKG